MKFKKPATFEDFADSLTAVRAWKLGGALADDMKKTMILKPGRYKAELFDVMYEAPRRALPRILFQIALDGVTVHKTQEIATPVGMANLLLDLSRMGIFPKRLGDLKSVMNFLSTRKPQITIDIERVDGVQFIHFVDAEDVSGWKALGDPAEDATPLSGEPVAEALVAIQHIEPKDQDRAPEAIPEPTAEMPVAPGTTELTIEVGDTILAQIEDEIKEVLVVKDYGDEVLVLDEGVKRIVDQDHFKGIVKKA